MKVKVGNYTLIFKVKKEHKTPILDKLAAHKLKQFWANSEMVNLQLSDNEIKNILNPYKLDDKREEV